MKLHCTPARKSSARLFSPLWLGLAAVLAGTVAFAQTPAPANPSGAATPDAAPMASPAAPASAPAAMPPTSTNPATPAPTTTSVQVVPSTTPGDAPPGLIRPPSIGDAVPTEAPPPPRMPLDFAEFAKDYKPMELLHPRWLSVQVGTVETPDAPPNGLLMFQKTNLLDADSRPLDFHPIEMECLFGVKSKYEQVAMIDHDPKGNPLKYSVSLGTVIYFLARDEDQNGLIKMSFFYYDATGLQWINDPAAYGAYLPTITGVWRNQDPPLLAPAEKYIFICLSQRVGPPRPGSTAKEVELYTYLVLFVHQLEAPEAPVSTAASPWSAG